MPRTYTITYDQVTPESAEDGDFSDHGFGDPSTLGSTSTRDMPGSNGTPEWNAVFDAAREAATETIEPDEYDIDAAEGDESAAAIRLVVGIIRDDIGATEPSCSAYSPGVWYTTPDGSTDYSDGTVTRLSVHLDGWTDAELRAIYAAVTGRK